MTLILDASAAYRLLSNDRLDVSVYDENDFLAPDIIIVELLNARWKVQRSGGSAPSVGATLDLIAHLRIAPTLPYASIAAALAEQLDHPAYDCFYVAMAQQEHARIVTADERLTRKLKRHRLGHLLA